MALFFDVVLTDASSRALHFYLLSSGLFNAFNIRKSMSHVLLYLL